MSGGTAVSGGTAASRRTPRRTRSERLIPARGDRVFAVLAEGALYDRWVVGTKKVRGVEPTWPAPGSQLFHAVGFGPFVVADATVVVEAEPPRRLLLEARARALGAARIEMLVTDQPGGTRVILDERVVRPRMLVWVSPLIAPVLRWRNAVSLRRLAQLVTARADAR